VSDDVLSQIGGTHYSQFSHQPLPVSIEWGLDGALYSALKYICRHNDKGTPVRDLKKACHFIAMELELRYPDCVGIASRVAEALEKGDSVEESG